MPVERVLELATPDELGIKLPTQLPMMLSFLDFRKIPLNGLWAETKFGTYGDSLSHGGVNMWINRQAANTTVTMSFPDNAIARESILRYIATLIQVFGRVARPTATSRLWLRPRGTRTTRSLPRRTRTTTKRRSDE